MTRDLQGAAGDFHAEVVQAPDSSTLVCHGDLDIATASRLRAIAGPLHGADLTLDLRPLDLVDSSGLREIVRLHQTLAPDHLLTVVALEGSLPWHLIELAGLDVLLDLRAG